jgi:hypothetical protein
MRCKLGCCIDAHLHVKANAYPVDEVDKNYCYMHRRSRCRSLRNVSGSVEHTRSCLAATPVRTTGTCRIYCQLLQKGPIRAIVINDTKFLRECRERAY